MKSYQAYFYDFDGTLADSRPGITECFRRTIAAMGLPEVSDEAIVATIGLKLEDAFFQLYPSIDEAFDKACVETYREISEPILDAKMVLMPGVKEVILAQKKRGCLVYVVSNRRDYSAKHYATVLGIDPYIDEYIGSNMVARPKPYPDMGILAWEKTGLPKERILMVGDTNNDVLLGQNAGFDTCFLTFGCGTLDSLGEARPTYILSSYKEMGD